VTTVHDFLSLDPQRRHDVESSPPPQTWHWQWWGGGGIDFSMTILECCVER
jgi:hypothetical protein